MSTIKLKALTTVVLKTMRETETNSEQTLSLYDRYGFSTIERHFEAIGVTDYSCDEVNNFVHTYRIEYERGAVSNYQWHLVRRSAALLERFYKFETVNLLALPKWGMRELSERYSKILEAHIAPMLLVTVEGATVQLKQPKALSADFYLRWKIIK